MKLLFYFSFITAAVKLAETRSVVEITMLLCSQVNHYYYDFIIIIIIVGMADFFTEDHS